MNEQWKLQRRNDKNETCVNFAITDSYLEIHYFNTEDIKASKEK